MKKIITIAILILILLLTLGSSKIYAETNVIDNQSQLIKIKDNVAKSLEDYKEKYGSDAYGLTAYILSIVRIYSIPF